MDERGTTMTRWEKPLVATAIGLAALTWITSGPARWVLAASVFVAAAPLWAWHLKDMIQQRRTGRLGV